MHPAIDDEPQLGHLGERLVGDAFGRYVRADLVQLGAHVRIARGKAIDAAENLREVNGFQSDAARLQDLLAESHCLECGGPRADRADARMAEAAHHAAGRHEIPQIRPEAPGVRPLRVQRRERVLDAVLREHVAAGHLAAERVAAGFDAHERGIVARRLDEDGHVQTRKPQRFRYRALVAEVGERDYDAGNPVRVLAEERGAGL